MENSSEFDEFFRRDFGRLVAFLIKMNFDRATAEDAAAEAMSAACRAWATVDNAGAWVRKVAYRTALRLSRRGTEGLRKAISGGWVPTTSDYAVEDTLAAVVEQPQIEYLLAKLPERQRLVLAWHLDGFTNAEIARGLGLAPATTRSTLRHARERLKKEFEAQDRMPYDAGEGGLA